MGSFLRPLGPLPPAVYWRRRILVFGIPLLLVALTAYACSGSGGSNTGAAGPSPTASNTGGIITPGPVPTGSLPPINSYPVTGPTGSGAPTGTAGGNGGGANGGGGAVGGVPVGSSGCVLSVTVHLDKSTTSGPPVYGPGQNPTFDVILRNVGTENCRFDISGKGVVVTVTRVDTGASAWTSATCAGGQDLRVLGPGDGYTEPVKWDREQSVSTCPVNPPTVGAGSFAVTAAVNGVTAASVQFALQ